MAINTLFSVSAHPSPSITIAKSKDEAVNIIQRMNNLFVLFFFWITSKYHKYKVQRRNEQYYPKDKQSPCYFLFLNNLQTITITKFKGWIKTYLVFFYLLWAINLELMFIVSNQNIVTQKGWATSMFIIPCEQPPIFSLKFFSKLEMC